MNKNKMEILGGTLAGMMFLSGCKPASETNKTPVVDASATLSGPTTRESPYVTYSPTKEAISTATPTRPDMGGGAYSSEQQTMIETGAFKDSEQALTAWFKYWANASNSPFNPETTDIHYKYVFDSTGKNAGVCMESTAYSSVCFALPIINGEVAKVPPTVNSEYTIPVGYGPLQLSDQLSADQVSTLKLDTSLTDSVLGYENGDWVRIKNGAVVGTLDLKTAQWVVVEKELTIADITPANMIYDEGTNSSVDGSDEAFKTGIVSDPDMERGYAVDVSERDFGNTGLKYKLLSGFVTDKVSYDEGTNLLRVPMAIMVDGSLRHFNVISYCGGEHNVIGIKYMVGRGNLSGYDYQSMENTAKIVPVTTDIGSNFKIGEQILIQIADPNSEEQYKDGLTFFRNYALTQVSEDYSSIKEVDFILDNMNAPDGYSAVNSLSEKTIADGSDVYLFIGEFHVPVVE